MVYPGLAFKFVVRLAIHNGDLATLRCLGNGAWMVYFLVLVNFVSLYSKGRNYLVV